MSRSSLVLLLALVATSISAFTGPLMLGVPTSSRSSRNHPAGTTFQTKWMASSSASVITTGPQGKPATSYEEDLRLTMQIIMDHEARSTTTSKEQMVQQVQDSLAVDEQASSGKVEPVDISIPYDAAAKNAYEASDKSMEYAAFKVKFEADAVAAVIAKQQPKKAAAVTTPAPPASAEPVDISVPYDAAAKLAYEASDKSMEYATFKEKFEADAVAAVVAKQQPKKTAAAPAAAKVAPVAVDISIPYDAAAKLAYESSDKSMEYTAFKAKYEADAVADVTAKQPAKKKTTAAAVETKSSAAVSVDLSIPYDAAAKLAYEASDKSVEYAAFKEKFEADAVADVMAKKST